MAIEQSRKRNKGLNLAHEQTDMEQSLKWNFL